MAETETRAAFITAALVLLVMPIVFVMGLASLMLFMSLLGMGEPSSLMLVIAAVWGVVVLVGVIVVAARLNRRSARS